MRSLTRIALLVAGVALFGFLVYLASEARPHPAAARDRAAGASGADPARGGRPAGPPGAELPAGPTAPGPHGVKTTLGASRPPGAPTGPTGAPNLPPRGSPEWQRRFPPGSAEPIPGPK